MAAAVVVVGDALLDVLTVPEEPMRPGADVPSSVRLAPGGQGANLAVRLARRGVPVELVCALGDDAAGRMLREALAAEGVRIAALPAEATGAVIVLVDAAGERTMLSQRVSFLEEVGRALPAAVDWLVVSGYLLLEPAAIRAVPALRNRAPHRVLLGCAVPDASLTGWQAAAEALEPDLVVLNRDEAARVPALARDRRVLTEPEGATATIGRATVSVRAPAEEPALDTTGAGDAFAAAFLAELLEAWPPSEAALRRALEAGVSAGAAATRVRGAQGRIPGEGSAMVDP